MNHTRRRKLQPSINLFPDQQDLVDRTRLAMREHKSILMQACTGFGKSACATYIAKNAAAKGKTVTVTVPRIELAKQLGATFRKYGINHGYINPKFRPNPFADVQIATTETLKKRLHKLTASDLLISDECHVGGNALTEIINHYKERGKHILGLSATPARMDGKGMDTWFDHMECGPSMRWLIDNGRLNKYRVFASEAAEAAMMAGADNLDKTEFDKVIFGDAAAHYKKYAWGKRGLAFCRTIKHAEDTAAYFNEAGIPSAAIHGKMSDEEMLRIVTAFATREILVITNCQIATFGWDLSQLTGMDATVECIFMFRFTDSLPLFMQIVGRMLRVSDDPSIMFDHASCIAKHGLPCADREWTLDGRLKGTGEAVERTVPVRHCPIAEGGCGFVHRPSPACPSCGRFYPIRDVALDKVETELIEISTEQLQEVKKQERQVQGRADTFEALLDLEARKGNKRGWAENVWVSRGNSKHGLAQRRAKWKAAQ